MIKNYIKIAFRSLRKQKLYSLINIVGLAVGLAFCLLVLLFVNDELTYDQFHTNKDRVYRLYREPMRSGFDRELAMPIPTGPAMVKTFPDVASQTRFVQFGTNIIRKEGQLFEQDEIVFAESTLFDLFSFPLVAGDPATALSRPRSVVITREAASKYFDVRNPVGQTMSIRLSGEFYDVTVTGIIEAPPSNSTIQFQMLLPLELLFQISELYSSVMDRWDATRVITYVMLREGGDVNHVQEQMPGFMSTYMGDIFDQMREEGTLETEGPPIVYQLQPMSDIHLNPEVPGGFVQPSNPSYSYILGGIALAVLIIACINFMLLAIDRSAKRAKEVGLRKVIGAQRLQLMGQFWGEALLLTLFAFLLGIVLAEAALPLFNDLSGKELSLSVAIESITIAGVIFGLFLLTGIVAGSYPALVLSGFKPIDSLKEKISLGGSNRFSKALIVIQFSLSVFLVIATLVMADQLRYIQNKDLGFRGEQVVVVPTNGLDGERVVNFYREALGNKTNIVDISGANVSFASGLWRRGFRYNGELRQVAVFRVDHNYVETLKMNIVQGRDFNPELASDSTESIIVNQTFLEEMGFQGQPVGKVFPIDWGWMKNPKIIGVVENFNYQSLENEIAPAVMYMNPHDPILNMMVRIRPENMSASIDQLRTTWANLTNEIPFTYSFLDEDMDALYRSERRWSKIVGYGSFFAILIACLGLFGLAGIVAIRRRKEIGIRKVLGASVSGIVALLSTDFARLVMVAIVIAAPLAYFAMQQWLQNFAYRIDLGLGVFLLAGLIALIIAVLTVGWQAVKAATANPVKSLRNE